MVAVQLPDANPARKPALDFARRYEAASGRHTVSIFAAYTGDIGLPTRHRHRATCTRKTMSAWTGAPAGWP